MHGFAGHCAGFVQLCASAQVTSQPHESRQSTELHASWPEHVTSHGPDPQRTVSHAVSPLHVTVQDRPSRQSTVRHAPAPHVIAQCQPDGHVTFPLGAASPSSMQVIVAITQLSQLFGHCTGASTQKPSTQVRLPVHSAGDAHASASLR